MITLTVRFDPEDNMFHQIVVIANATELTPSVAITARNAAGGFGMNAEVSGGGKVYRVCATAHLQEAGDEQG